jgi:chromosome segregation ATPase
MDDRTAFYREQEEELKATYLVYETKIQDVLQEKLEAERWDARLKRVDRVASPENLTELRVQIEEAEAMRQSLTDKWDAYQRKMYRMEMESRIADSRAKKRPLTETLEEIERKRREVSDRLRQLHAEMQEEEQEYRQNDERLTEIIDDQRRKIVAHLTGHDEQPPLSAEESK